MGSVTTYTWVGGNDGNSASFAANWTPSLPGLINDIILVPADSTINFNGSTLSDNTITINGPSTTVAYNGVIASSDSVTVGSGVTWNIIGTPTIVPGTPFNNYETVVTGSTITGDTYTFGTGDTLGLTDTSLNTSNLTFASGDTLDLTGSIPGSMIIDLNLADGSNGSQIHQSGSDSTLTINATGTVYNGGFIWPGSSGGTTTLNILNEGTQFGQFNNWAPVIVTGGTLVVNGGTTVENGSTLYSTFANGGFLFEYGGTQASLVQINARMDSLGGQMDILGGAYGATLELNTSTSGSQAIVFGDGDGTLKIDNNTLPYATNTTVLANTKARIIGFQPGDTIDLAGLAPSGTGLTYSFGIDATYGPTALELFNNGVLIATLRMTGGEFTDGTGDLSGGVFSGTGNFVLASDGHGGTQITLTSTGLNNGTVAIWAGGTSGAWSNTALWTGGGAGAGGLPTALQTAEFTMTAAEANAASGGGFSFYTITVAQAESAGSVIFSDPLATLNIEAPLTLETEAGESGGGTFQETQGTVDILAGGTLTAADLNQMNGGTLEMGTGSVLNLSGEAPYSTGLGLSGLAVEDQAFISGGTINSAGWILVGEKSPGSVTVEAGSTITDSYAGVGGATYANPMDWTSQLTIDGPTTRWTDAGGDSTTPYSGAMLVGGGYTSVSSTLDNGNYVVSVPNGGTGQLDVDDYATLTEASYAVLGVTQTSTGDVTVSNGALWLINTGVATPGSIVVGQGSIYTPGSGGGVVPVLTVGLQGFGSLDIESGGTVQLGTIEAANTYKMVIGQGGTTNASAVGMVVVDGPGALLNTGGGPMAIGNRGSGALTVSNGGTVLVGDGGATTGISFGAVLGNKNAVVNSSTIPSSGTLTVLGNGTTDSQFTVQSGGMVIGRGGSGTADINSGGDLSVAAGTIYLGGTGTGDGANATGPGGTLNVNGGQVQAGGIWALDFASEISRIEIDDSGTVTLTAWSGHPAVFNVDDGSAEITGGGTLSLDSTGTAEVGGGAALNVDNNGSLEFATNSGATSYRLMIGDSYGNGSVYVQNSGARIDAGGPISVGQSNSGTLEIGNDATVTASVASVAPWAAVVGNQQSGTVQVGGFGGGGALFTTTGALVVGLDSFGSLKVEQGGSVSVSSELDVGGTPLATSNGTGQVTIDGGGTVDGAQLSVTGSIVVGNSATLGGNSGITVINGGSLNATGTAYLGGKLGAASEAGMLTLQTNAEAQVGGLVLWTVAGFASDVSVDSSSELLIGTGAISASPGEIVIASGAEVSGSGRLSVTGTIVDNGIIAATVPGSANELTVLGPITGDGTLSIAAAATLDVGPVASTDTIVFGPGPQAVLALSTASPPFMMNGVIEGFYSGDTIDLLNVYGSMGTSWNQVNPSGGTLTVTQNGSAVAAFHIAGTYTNASFAWQSDSNGGTDVVGQQQAPCFAAGTRVATTRGEVAVEALRVGDRVRLARGGTAPVIWLGHRAVACARHPRPWDVMPVRVAAHAFGSGRPRSDLLLSPDHAVFMDGMLIPIRYLLNGATIAQETVPRVTYWHVELDHHDALLAEGLACESYLDTGNRSAFAGGGGATMMHPDFARGVWEREACAPLVIEGVELEAARSYLLERAHGLGFSITEEADLRLLVDGETLWPDDVAGGCYRFTLPGDAGSVVIASRAAVPREISAAHEDGRRLGVMLERVTFSQRGEPCEVPLDMLPDGDGFHACERDRRHAWRWTDGHARMEVPAGFVPDEPLELELRVAAGQPAWRAPARQAGIRQARHDRGDAVVAAA